ncbi:uncharacterized protein J4E78_005416 [Alternaria triticimaculans]|uniref:uncharacterized protein n=1 Tax=Alternaria triticimaculans TaxID=297637 RepID=UPI0020C563C3|nr:uncharacterized protein J4E78_005416 [Alternaria triticimaculans]KAI4658993.1 hypothetical protein J4E78_005416 [Alternaria triticimaculans]
MRLLHLRSDVLSLVEFLGKDIPRYGILSHTWASDLDEVSLRDINDGATLKDITDSIDRKAGYTKIIFCAKQAAKDGLEYFWVDTCCIDKSSSAELSEAINSMFRWYQEAAKCYVYLSDVSIKDGHSFEASRWFTRGWTLQELVAPKVIGFYTVEGEFIGDKSSLLQEIERITKIPPQVLQGGDLFKMSVEERLSNGIDGGIQAGGPRWGPPSE